MAEQIPDPFYAMNELEVQWVGREDWSFCRTFTLTAKFLKNENIVLELGSVDTVAEFWINGHWAWRESKHVRHRCVSKYGRFSGKGENEIRILLKSPRNRRNGPL